jgi:hypothetical protein
MLLDSASPVLAIQVKCPCYLTVLNFKQHLLKECDQWSEKTSKTSGGVQMREPQMVCDQKRELGGGKQSVFPMGWATMALS